MARKRYKPEEIVSLLRQSEVLHGQGMSMADAIRQLGISEVTCYRWRKEYGGMSGDQLRRLNDKRVERLWRREGLKVPGKQPKRGRLWLNDGSCVRLRAERADHVWSYDFVHHRTHDGRAFRMLNVLDEFTRESLAIRVRRKLSSADVIDVLTDLFILRGVGQGQDRHRASLGLCARRRALRRPGPAGRSVPLLPGSFGRSPGRAFADFHRDPAGRRLCRLQAALRAWPIARTRD